MLAAKRSLEAQLRSAQAAARQSQTEFDYTEIRAPVDGRISRTAVTVGNVVGPGSGTLATIVSQDPMYVLFPIPMRTAVDLRDRYAAKGGFKEVTIKLRLPDGRLYQHSGVLDLAEVTVNQDTDTLTLRGTMPNPRLATSEVGGARLRELVDGEFVTVIVESASPVPQLTLPREAVLADQGGDFVYVVGANNDVERRAVQLGQSTNTIAVVAGGLSQTDRVVLEGTQRVQPGVKVTPKEIENTTTAADDLSANRS